MVLAHQEVTKKHDIQGCISVARRQESGATGAPIARQTTPGVVWFPRRSMFFTKYILVFCPPGQPAAVQILFQTNLLRTAFNAPSLARLCSFCRPEQNVLKTCHSSARSRGRLQRQPVWAHSELAEATGCLPGLCPGRPEELCIGDREVTLKAYRLKNRRLPKASVRRTGK